MVTAAADVVSSNASRAWSDGCSTAVMISLVSTSRPSLRIGEAEQRADPPGGQPFGREGAQALPPYEDALTRQCPDSLAHGHAGYAVP